MTWGERYAFMADLCPPTSDFRPTPGHPGNDRNRNPNSKSTNVPPTTHAQLLLEPNSPELRFLPEGPYPAGLNRISWVAIQHGPGATFGSINRLDLTSQQNVSWQLPGRPGFAFGDPSGELFVTGCERQLGIFDTRSRTWQLLADGIDADREGTVINDGMLWEGNLIFGTKDLKFETPKAGLYLWRRADRQLLRLRDDQTCSNGKAIRRSSAGGLELLDIDTPTKRLVAYPFDLAAGTLGSPSTLLDLTDQPDFPDGMILTPDQGSVIISFYHPGEVSDGQTRQYHLADGRLEHTWLTAGSPRATCPQLIEHDGRIRLVITTADEGMSAALREIAPRAGCLFIAETDWDRPSSAPAWEPLE